MSKGRFAVLAASMALIASALIPAAASAWAPAKTAPVHPGVQVFTEGAQCTANFVFQEGSDVYLGQAAHCSGTGGQTETDGCTSGSLPIGTPVEVTGASRPGTLAYNSWLTMQASGESDLDTCAYNDFALIKIDPADVGKVNPSVPPFGGHPDRHRHRRQPRLGRLLVRQFIAAGGDHQTEPEAGHRDSERRRRLEPCGRDPDSGRAGRLG
ncbi:MAG: hypothetical protein WD827_03410 [Solirubrobacterales bacterium]